LKRRDLHAILEEIADSRSLLGDATERWDSLTGEQRLTALHGAVRVANVFGRLAVEPIEPDSAQKGEASS